METRSLWLVRHGQASFGKSDYDNLSPTGHEQAYLLGKSLRDRDIRPTLLISGSMKRHRQTMAEIVAGAGWDVSESMTSTSEAPSEKPHKKAPDDLLLPAHHRHRVQVRVNEDWNELDHTALLTAYRPAYKNMLLLKADMVRTLRPRAAFEETFERAVDRWTSGDHDEDYPESFSAFTARVNSALQQVLDAAPAHALIVTSAGPLCWATSHIAAGGSVEAWKRFTLGATNTGVTRITIDQRGPGLLTFNEISHLDAPGLTTNR